MKVIKCTQTKLFGSVGVEKKGQLEKNHFAHEQEQQKQPTFWGGGVLKHAGLNGYVSLDRVCSLPLSLSSKSRAII